jgi:hypothetical protein
MADTAISLSTYADLTALNVKIGQGTAIVHANTHVITPTGPLEDLIILVANTEGSTNTVTVLAGDDPPAQSAGQGAWTSAAIAATTGHVILPPLESARFLQNNGTVRITVEADMTGWIQAFQRPQI